MQKLSDINGPGEDYFVAEEKRITGNPRQTVWMQYTDASGQFMVGFWRSQVGKWKIAYTEEEYCSMLSGVSVVTHMDGTAMTVRAGDSFVIPRGFVGTWEVLEETTKRFVMYDRAVSAGHA